MRRDWEEEEGRIGGVEEDGKAETEERKGGYVEIEAAGLMDVEGERRGCDGGVRNEKARQRGFCPICGIIIRCVSVCLGKDIIKETQGRPGSPSSRSSAALPSLPATQFV